MLDACFDPFPLFWLPKLGMNLYFGNLILNLQCFGIENVTRIGICSIVDVDEPSPSNLAGDTYRPFPEGPWTWQLGHCRGCDGVWGRIRLRDPWQWGGEDWLHQDSGRLHRLTSPSKIRAFLLSRSNALLYPKPVWGTEPICCSLPKWVHGLKFFWLHLPMDRKSVLSLCWSCWNKPATNWWLWICDPICRCWNTFCGQTCAHGAWKSSVVISRSIFFFCVCCANSWCWMDCRISVHSRKGVGKISCVRSGRLPILVLKLATSFWR